MHRHFHRRHHRLAGGHERRRFEVHRLERRLRGRRRVLRDGSRRRAGRRRVRAAAGRRLGERLRPRSDHRRRNDVRQRRRNLQRAGCAGNDGDARRRRGSDRAIHGLGWRLQRKRSHLPGDGPERHLGERDIRIRAADARRQRRSKLHVSGSEFNERLPRSLFGPGKRRLEGPEEGRPGDARRVRTRVLHRGRRCIRLLERRRGHLLGPRRWRYGVVARHWHHWPDGVGRRGSALLGRREFACKTASTR